MFINLSYKLIVVNSSDCWYIIKSFNSKKNRKVNSFYLDNKNNINLSTTSSRQTPTARNTLDTSYNGMFVL